MAPQFIHDLGFEVVHAVGWSATTTAPPAPTTAPGRTRAASELCRWSSLCAGALGREDRIVAKVHEDLTSKRAVLLGCRPAAAGDRITLVEALPGEFHARTSVAGYVSPVEPTLYRDEPEAAHVVRLELDEPQEQPGPRPPEPTCPSPRSATFPQGRSSVVGTCRISDRRLPRNKPNLPMAGNLANGESEVRSGQRMTSAQ